MGIPANVGKLVIRGTGVGSEIWQTGLWFQRPDLADMADLSEFKLYAADLSTPVGLFWSAIKGKVYTSFALTGYTMYWYRGGPRAALVVDTPLSAAAGTLATNGSPADTSCVVSLITETSGRRGRGRMYLPRHEACVPTTGLFATDGSSYVGAVAGLIHNMIAATHSVQGRVLSQADSVVRNIVTLRADQLPDVQRRRENRMAKGTISTQSAPF